MSSLVDGQLVDRRYADDKKKTINVQGQMVVSEVDKVHNFISNMLLFNNKIVVVLK